MNNRTPFKWRLFEDDSILLGLRCYLRFSLSYRDLEEMMRERGLQVDHTTIYRWVRHSAPGTGATMQAAPQSHQIPS